ncbi:HNH endonuclease [Streptomyces sp. ODS28]|uniref:HNH endonuclease n=1 Tax=Streptomyces sp. ODS28 TaxID=3136688 RepID=UPI0031EDF8DC
MVSERDVAAAANAAGNSVRSDADEVQWLLQPRGGAKQRGPENFRHSVRNGIRLSEYEKALGEHAAEFHRLFPDGVARLWGATPAKRSGDDKAIALRDRKPGDEVLFYAKWKFIAKARILGLFHSPALAEAVWGVEADTAATWEHIIALGDVVEFEVPAEPVLKEVSARYPLRSLTLVPAPARSRALHLLTGEHEGPVQESSRTADVRAATAIRKRDELLRALEDLGPREGEGPGPQHALALMWAIGRQMAGEPRLAPWETFQGEVGPILRDFGPSTDLATPEHVFSHLAGHAVWEAKGINSAGEPAPYPEDLRRAGAKAGLERGAAGLLRKPLIRAEAIGVLRSYLGGIDQEALLERVGLSGYASASGLPDGEAGGTGADGSPAARREGRSTRPDRDAKLAEEVKRLYGHRCQVCGTRLERRYGYYSEAAHIQGLGQPHCGPDSLTNLLCLCPNHHVQFDDFAIYIDEDGNVCRTRDGKCLGPLLREEGHLIDERYVRYHRSLCGIHDEA